MRISKVRVRMLGLLQNQGMIEGLMIVALSIGFVVFITRTLGLEPRRGKRSARAPVMRKRGKAGASLRLVLAVVASACLLSLLAAVLVRYLVKLLERSLS